MKLWLAGIAVLMAASYEPQPKLDLVDVTPVASVVKIRGFFRSPGNPDSNITTLTATALPEQRHALPGSATRDSFTVARPAAGGTVSGQFCVQSTKRQWIPASPVCAPWTYTEPAVLPPPIIDSVRADTLLLAMHLIGPDTLFAPTAGEWCTVYEMESGMVAYRGPRHPTCDSYPGLPPSVEAQTWVDTRACTSYEIVALDPQGHTLTLVPVEPCAGLIRAEAR